MQSFPVDRFLSTSTFDHNDCLTMLCKSIYIVNDMMTPEVHYNTWKEFVKLVYFVQEAFCSLVEKDVTEELETKYLSRLIGYEFTKMPTLQSTKQQGPLILQILTKNTSSFWCEMVSHFVCTRALRAAWIFNDIHEILNLEDLRPKKTQLMINTMQQEIRHSFAGTIPFSIYTVSSGFIATLLVKNFTFFSDIHFTAFTNAEYQDMILTLCMGMHSRLGQNSILLTLKTDILRAVCAQLCVSEQQKHIIAHKQEEWLY
jgi:hypothetical protein